MVVSADGRATFGKSMRTRESTGLTICGGLYADDDYDGGHVQRCALPTGHRGRHGHPAGHDPDTTRLFGPMLYPLPKRESTGGAGQQIGEEGSHSGSAAPDPVGALTARSVGSSPTPSARTYVIAELGSNHCRDLDHTKHLIRTAAWAGANAVKLQLWEADKMYRRGTMEHAAAAKWQLPKEWIPALKQACDEAQVDFLCTAFDFDSLDYIDPFVRAHKVASIEATWLPFLERVNQKRKPVYLSVGAMTWTEVGEAQDALQDCDVTTLQCVVSYPAKLEDYNLLAIEAFYQSGVSDHTTDPITVPMTAVALGATAVEKHMRGLTCSSPDAPHAINERQFAEMVRGIRNVEKALGRREKRIRPAEEPYLKYRRGPLGLRGA